jgi:hypothetical protein
MPALLVQTDKAPFEDAKRTINWLKNGVIASSDVISNSTWAQFKRLVDGTLESTNDLALTADFIDGPITGVRVGGGIEGHDYILVNQITLADGQKFEQSILVRCRART